MTKPSKKLRNILSYTEVTEATCLGLGALSKVCNRLLEVPMQTGTGADFYEFNSKHRVANASMLLEELKCT